MPCSAARQQRSVQRMKLVSMVLVIVDVGACGSDSTPVLTSPHEQSLAAPITSQSGAISKMCANHSIEITDVRGDARDIWAGRETAATGKQVGTTPAITLRFNHALDPTLLSAALTPTGTTGQTGSGVGTDCRTVTPIPAIRRVPIGAGYPAGTW